MYQDKTIMSNKWS